LTADIQAVLAIEPNNETAKEEQADLEELLSKETQEEVKKVKVRSYHLPGESTDTFRKHRIYLLLRPVHLPTTQSLRAHQQRSRRYKILQRRTSLSKRSILA
jgi:hypothetical protein